MLNRQCIEEFLTEDQKERFFYEETVDSTNTRLKQYIKSSEGRKKDGSVFFVANRQTQGKGRRGRDFQSDLGLGIYLSMSLFCENEMEKISEITAWAAVAVARAIKNVIGIELGIKWVNDLVFRGKKVAGILTELVYDPYAERYYVIIGIGVNVHYREENFSKDIVQMATSLDIIANKEVSRAELLQNLVRQLEQLQADWPTQNGEYLEQYKRLCVTTGKEVRILTETEQRIGIAKEITDSFQLKVEYPNGTEEIVSSGEVSVRGMYGYL